MLLFCSANAQEKGDTLRIYELNTVEVSASPLPSASRSAAPLQVLQGRDLEKLNALQVSDAAKFFSGAQVKDYGGVGGLKTVSIRSLGANYTGVFYDGAPVSNYQTGQTDVGRFSLENVERLTLQIGESDDLFQTARHQSGAGALSIVRKQALSDTDKRQRLTAAWKAGSWGFRNPSLLYEQRINDRFTADIAADWMQTDGDYPYRSGSGEEKTRLHSEVEALRLEGNLTGRLSNGGLLKAKLYGYDSDRSLPGPDIYYVNSRGEAAREKQAFSQASYEQSLSGRLKFRVAGKFDYSESDYTHYSSNYPSGEKSYHYIQREYYLGSVFLYAFSPQWSVSWANDGAYGAFRNDFSGIDPDRTTWQSALSVKYTIPRLTATASLFSHFSHDTRRKAQATEKDDIHRLSPYAGISVQPFAALPFRLRAFYKQTFRQTALGDMYFSPVPPSGLKPEKARQYNLGLSWVSAPAAWMPYFSLTVDAYRNKIDDKLWAIPKSSLYIWSIQNIDVDIKGVDVQTTVHLQAGKYLNWQAGGSYTYQQVLDVTKPGTDIYKQQMMYAPQHTASGYLSLSTPWVDVNYALIYSGSRYFERINRKEYRMDPYTDQSIALSRSFSVYGISARVSAECLNLADSRYDVVRSYPMPGRSFRLGLKLVY